jgi:putative AlgH/UPF0301 family transcriptional regulator
VLLSHPLVQGPLRNSCVLILENGDKGTYGVVLNHRTDYKLGGAVKALPGAVNKAFSEYNCSFGGMVRRLQYLHTVPDCGGKSVPGCAAPLFAGMGLKKATMLYILRMVVIPQ